MINCKLLKNCSLIRLKASGLRGNVRKVPVTREAAEKLLGPAPFDMNEEEREKQIQTALQRLKASTKLVVCPELQAIQTFQAEFRQYVLNAYCNPSFIDDGLYTIRTELATAVTKEFEKADNDLSGLVDTFLSVYPEEVEKAERVWGIKAVSGLMMDPDRIRGQFKIEYRLTQFDVPEGLPPEIRAQEERKLREVYDNAERAIVGALWGEFKRMLDEVTGKLVVGDNGKKKVFRDTLFEDLTAFVGAFKNRNVFNDSSLEQLVTQANELIARVGGADNSEAAQRMRDYDGLREATREAFVKLSEATQQAIMEEPTRAFTFDE